MMKIKLLLLTFTIVSFSFSGCSKTIDIYALGSAHDIDGINTPGYWKNDVWINLSTLDDLDRSGTYCITVNNNNVYIGGYIKTEKSTWLPGYWFNDKWIELPRPEGYGKAAVDTIEIYNDDIYAAGFCYDGEGNRISGYWKNSVWQSLLPLHYDQVALNSFSILDGDLYWSGSPVGYFQATDSPGYYINTNWIDLSLPEQYTKGEVRSVQIENGDIYALGYCLDSSDKKVPGYWKDNIWLELPYPKSRDYVYVHKIALLNNDLYAVCNRGGYWKNGEWINITQDSEHSYINNIVIHEDEIYLSGHKTVNSGFIPSYWRNGLCTELESPIPGNDYSDIIHSFIVYEYFSNDLIQNISRSVSK